MLSDMEPNTFDQEQLSPLPHNPLSRSKARTRTALGLFSNTTAGASIADAPGVAPSYADGINKYAREVITSRRKGSVETRNVTARGTIEPVKLYSPTSPTDELDGNISDDESECDNISGKRQGSTRSQLHDGSVSVMSSVNRRYGRRRKLNSGQQKPSDPRSLFAPFVLAQAATNDSTPPPDQSSTNASSKHPTSLVPNRTLLAHQLIMTARNLIVNQNTNNRRQSGQHLLKSSANCVVRPRASMPLISGARKRPQRIRSQLRVKNDEFEGALTMKSVEIRGGRILLDDPSSSSSSGNESDESEGISEENTAAAAPAPNRSVVPTHTGFADALRHRWYVRRCLGLKQPFESIHRLAKAEHDSASPFPLINDVRKVLCEYSCVHVENNTTVCVLLCTDSIIISAPRTNAHEDGSLEEKTKSPLKAIPFSSKPAISLDGDSAVKITTTSGNTMTLLFTEHNDKPSVARSWIESALQAQTRLEVAMHNIQLDSEDHYRQYHNKHFLPPPLLARGRSSIAGSTPDAGIVSAAGDPNFHMRKISQGGVYWVPDNETKVCMVCQKTAFSMMVRRHHCRACGLVICYRCSVVDSSNSERRRLCVRCEARRPQLPKRLDSPSLQTLGRRAAEFLPDNDIVMQMAAQKSISVNSISPPQSCKGGQVSLDADNSNDQQYFNSGYNAPPNTLLACPKPPGSRNGSRRLPLSSTLFSPDENC